MANIRTTTDLEALARKIAAAAGIDWDQLETYPGYTRNQLFEQARLLDRLCNQPA